MSPVYLKVVSLVRLYGRAISNDTLHLMPEAYSRADENALSITSEKLDRADHINTLVSRSSPHKAGGDVTLTPNRTQVA